MHFHNSYINLDLYCNYDMIIFDVKIPMTLKCHCSRATLSMCLYNVILLQRYILVSRDVCPKIFRFSKCNK